MRCCSASTKFHPLASVQIRNVSATLRRLRLVPPASQLFHVLQCSFPCGHGLVAPGMAAAATMRFTPDTRVDAADTLVVDTELSRFEVPLRARRAPPALSLPRDLDVGRVYAGSALVKRITVACSGGGGAFQVLPAERWPPGPLAHVGEAKDGHGDGNGNGNGLAIGECFLLRPARFEVAGGGAVELAVEYSPRAAGAAECCIAVAHCGLCCLHRPLASRASIRRTLPVVTWPATRAWVTLQHAMQGRTPARM
jgi:hypothetical protein